MKHEVEALLNKRLRDLFLEEAKAAERNDHAAKRMIAYKRRYLSRLVVNQLDIFPEPSVFLSFSDNSGANLGKRAITVCQDRGILVKTGFDNEVQAKLNVLSAVKEAINSCTLFLGIWTAEYDLVDRGGDRRRAAPSVWMLEEKGMAQAFNKPFRLLVEDSIHNDFWLKTTPGKLQHRFDKSNFESQLRLAVEALIRRYHERHVVTSLIDLDDLD
jgi:hypothetical protein